MGEMWPKRISLIFLLIHTILASCLVHQVVVGWTLRNVNPVGGSRRAQDGRGQINVNFP